VPGEGAALAIDGAPRTHWHSRWSPDSPGPPHALAIDLGEQVTVTGFGYQPRWQGDNGTIADYDFEVRRDGGWQRVASGTFGDGPQPRIVRLPAPAPQVDAVRLIARREVHGRPWASCAELLVLVD